MMTTVTLPKTMDRTTSAALVHQLREGLAQGDMVVDGREVARIGQSGLQLLLSLQQTAKAHGTPIVVHASPAMFAAGRTAGMLTTFAWVGQDNDE